MFTSSHGYLLVTPRCDPHLMGIFKQILDGKAKFIIIPKSVAELDIENLEQFLVEKFAGPRIVRATLTSTKNNGSFGLTGKRKMDFVFFQVFCPSILLV
jgi:hypothetical protein